RAGQGLQYLVLGALRRPIFHQRVDLALALPAGRGRLVPGVADQVGPANDLQQRMPELLRHEEEDVVVGAAGMAAIRRAWYAGAELVTGALAGLAGALMIAQADADQIDHRVLHRDLDLLAFTGEVPLHQRGENADHAVHAGARIPDGRPHIGRRIVGKAGDAHRAAHRLRDRFVALVVGVGPVRAEALDARVDQARVELLDRRIAEAEALDDARAEVLEQHVAGLQQGAKHVLGARVLEIQGEASLVRVEGQIEEAVRVGPIREHLPGGVALDRLFHLDHVGPEPGQHLTARGPRLIVRDIDDPDARQRSAHW